MASSSHSHIGLHAPTFFFFFLLLLQIIVPLVTPISFDFNGFKEGDLNLAGEARVTRSHIHVTANSRDQIYKNSVGRVTWPRPVRLWDAASPSRNLTDFATTFSFVIYSDQSVFADGLAFFLADPDLPPLTNIKLGSGLGIIDGDFDGDRQVLNSTKLPFVAVEFDTWHNTWDPEGIHVGININSMESVDTKPWFPHISKRTSYNCSVKYDSQTFNLTVAFTAGKNRTEGISGEINSFSYKVDLREHLPESVILGFSAATGNLFEVHILESWSFNSTLEEEEEEEEEDSDNSKHQKIKKILILVGLGSVIGLSSTFLSIIGVVLWRRIKSRRKESSKAAKGSSSVYDIHKMDDEFNKETGPKSFSYSALKMATHNFSDSKKLGQGGFGAVYKGYVKELNCHVAIKRISRDSAQGIKEYSTEVKVISQLRHRNLVQLLGWCHKKNDLLLVYEYMPNRSLDSYLCNNDDKPKPSNKLTWQARYNVALGLASALLYLQEEWSQCVLHRDIKSSNVMLDSSFNAKLGDFGLACLVSHEKGSRTTMLAGTRGYIAPEYVFTGKMYRESDVYSFGVVLLEMATGRKAMGVQDKTTESGTTVISVVEWVWGLYGKGEAGEAADPGLVGEYEEKEMERMLVVGLWCTYPEYKMRPNVREVIKVLKFESDLPVIPLTMPVPVYLPPAIKAMFSSLEASFWAKCSGP